MNKAITISTTISTTYMVEGTIIDKKTKKGVVDLRVLVYDEDPGSDDFLGIAVTNENGVFQLSFDASQFRFFKVFDRNPDLYFIVKDAGLELLNTKDNVIKNASESTPAINLEVDLSGDKLREEVEEVAVDGWVGGFEQSNPAFAYPNPDLSSLDFLDNMDNIKLLQRQQKVLWPEFSWKTEPDKEDGKRCYRMFAPDISRLGYTNEGRIYSIICPQSGYSSPTLGSLNVEVTVTGNRGWVNEDTKELAADMGVIGKIWFAPSAKDNKYLNLFKRYFEDKNLGFPFSKANAIQVRTHAPNDPGQSKFKVSQGSSTRFPIPEFAKHEGIAWALGHIEVQIGELIETGQEEVDRFNQFILDIFNLASGNMLKNGNMLTWNLWLNAPELVDVDEWQGH
ncbi:MAG: hypothetical protein O4808_11995, partial [Trichodesmium sp. St17_bin3_1_1]|nr:hypothetical protein [Trichodesmium sp. St17_bin3_1_1]